MSPTGPPPAPVALPAGVRGAAIDVAGDAALLVDGRRALRVGSRGFRLSVPVGVNDVSLHLGIELGLDEAGAVPLQQPEPAPDGLRLPLPQEA